MNLIEVHLIQSFPFTCLNRDDVGAPKSAIFGGVQRARVSSQCWKRAIREYAFGIAPEYFAGKRGLYHSESLAGKLVERGIDENKAQKIAEEAISSISSSKEEGKKATLLYLSTQEIEALADQLVETMGEKIDSKKIAKAIKGIKRKDAVDISLFGRMVASEPALTLEAAGMFSHALSTHAAANEVDFFSAVDDTKPKDVAGAAHINVFEANSACYYRYVGLNLDLFNDSEHLKDVDVNDRRAALNVFLRAVLEAVPGARKNSMFGYTLPQFALAFVRQGQPLSLINAFEKPIKADREGGYVAPSIEELKKHWDKMKKAYCLTCKGEFTLDDESSWLDSIVTCAMGE